MFVARKSGRSKHLALPDDDDDIYIYSNVPLPRTNDRLRYFMIKRLTIGKVLLERWHRK